jgi:hypothetical protein
VIDVPSIPFAQSTPWEWLLWLLGYDDLRQAPPGSKVVLELTNFPASWGVFVLIAVVAAMLWGVFWLYRREIDTCPLWVKMLLAGLRTGVVLLLTCIYLGPALVYHQYRTVQPTLIVARDASDSMNTTDAYDDPAAAKAAAGVLGMTPEQVKGQKLRVALVNRLFERDNRKLLAELAQRGKVQAVDFADRVEKVEVRKPGTKGAESKVPSPKSKVGDTKANPEPQALNPLPPLVADGRGTDLWLVIREALSADNPAAIVLVTDGQHTGKDDPRIAAREAKERGVPLLVVGVGDPSRPRNVKVDKVYARPHAWQDEPFEIDAVVHTHGFTEGEVRVELIEQKVNDSDQAVGSGTVVQTQQLDLSKGGGRATVQFSHTVKDAGRFVYSVRIEPLEGESDDRDNEKVSAGVVKVLSRERIRVLLVAGAPSWEYRLVQKLLQRDKTITLSCWLQTLDEERAQEGSRQITRLPISKEELFYYDVVLLFDPNPQEFDKEWIELVKTFVGDHSGGLLFMAGPKHSGRLLTNPRTSEMGTVLPVSFGDVEALEVATLLSTNQRAWPLKTVPANADHPVMRFYPNQQETLQRWETLPGIFWSFPVEQPKPTATVLLEHSDPTLRSVEGSRPLLVAGRYGSGHTRYLGFNGTWRWRKAGRQAEFFDKFWVQAVRYLVEGRSLEGRRRGTVSSENDQYEIGDKVVITARLLDASYNPLVQPRVEATIQTGDSVETVYLLPVPTQPGTYEGSLTAKKTGDAIVRVRSAVAESEGAAIETQFSVDVPRVEHEQTWLDKALLTDLASLSGGKYFDLDQVAGLAAAVPDKSETIEVRGKPDPLWDVRGMLVVLVGLLAAEWAIRKRYKLL